MSIDVQIWSIQRVLDSIEKIDPKPQYQRSPVWNIKRKKLLIDSIFQDFDIPKFYFNKLVNNRFFDFEVADGQQRLRAIHEFYKNDFTLDKVVFKNEIKKNIYFKDLELELKDKFLKYSLTITILNNTSTEKVREIFSRLQMGVGLNQAELRRAIASNIGFYVQSIIENHRFFKSCGIKDTRNKHQDYIDHCIAFIHNGFEKDLKGINLKQVYVELSASNLAEIAKTVTNILSKMEKVNDFQKGIFKNKWGFVDTFIFLYGNLSPNKEFYPKKYYELFKEFEQTRLKYGKNPDVLIEGPSSSTEKRRLYNYIMAFKTGGALKNNLKTRADIFEIEFKESIK